MSSPQRKRFVAAFLKGMAAPAYALELRKMPEIPSERVKTRIAKNSTNAFKSDWERIASDFSISIERKQKALERG